LGRRLKILLPGSHLYFPKRLSSTAAADEFSFAPPLKLPVSSAFGEYRYLILIMAAGIAVRTLAPLLRDKHRDPGVVVVDDAGAFAVSLLSGHAGGANKLARKVANCLGALPVVTTGSDVTGTIGVDILGKEFGWEIQDGCHPIKVSSALIDGLPTGIYQDAGEKNWTPKREAWPENLHAFHSLEDLARAGMSAAILITDRTLDEMIRWKLPESFVIYRPRSLVVGIGCNRGTSCDAIQAAVKSAFSKYRLSVSSIKNLATIDLKKDEPGLREFARKNNLPVDYFDKRALGNAGYPSPPSDIVMKHAGTPSVCESAAILSGGSIVGPKVIFNRAVTVAIARLPQETLPDPGRGKIYLVGTGPGDPSLMTLRAREAIDVSDVIIGYKTYVLQIQSLLSCKEVIATGMGNEVERIKVAVSLAREGKTVSVISGGDSGIYGMAGMMGEALAQTGKRAVVIEVVPGVPALAAAAALLGSPLSNDFACVSLSDHLVPWQEICQRLRLAAQGSFVIVLYNPRSRQRPHHLEEAREIISRFRSPATVAGIVRDAYRPGQRVVITDLGHLPDYEIDMNSIVIIGNSTTFSVDGWMATPRGYTGKYQGLIRGSDPGSGGPVEQVNKSVRPD
jgi:cobalt-precorrin 5A hydrolase / precorrin-3B C17-methyltransferase